jgi:hypothetical protein
MSGGDGMCSSTQVTSVRCTWVLRPIMPDFKWSCLTMSQPQWCLPGIGEPPGMTVGARVKLHG